VSSTDRAERSPLERMLAARSVAVVGASVKEGSLGRQMMLELERGGYDGAVYPVNPGYDEVLGHRCFGAIGEIPEPVDLADVDRDGRADVITLHGGWNRAGVHLQDATYGGLGPEELFPIPYASGYNRHGLAVGDVNSAKIVMKIVVSTVPMSGMRVMKKAPTEMTSA